MSHSAQDLKNTLEHIHDYVESITSMSWVSFPAHVNYRRRSIYWGSDFLMKVDMSTTYEDIDAAVKDYLDNRMRVR